MFERTAVETHQIALLSEHACKLVHYATVHAAIIMFGALADSGKLEFVYIIVVEQVVYGKCEAALQCSRRTEARTIGHIARKCGIEAFHMAAALEHLAAYAEYIASPLRLRQVFLTKPELAVRIVIVDTDKAHTVAAVGLYFGHNHLIDGSGEYEAPVVVGVLAYKVDTSGRGIELAVAAETLLKGGVDFFF